MLFNSFEFLLFFPIVTLLYFILPYKYRWLLLLIASCVFYTAFIPVYILILFFTIIIDYVAGIKIESAVGKQKKWFLILSIIANVGVLAVFKYYNFFIENTNALLESLHITTHPLPYLGIILPIGLSFHTFQAMSYTIEVYRGHQKAERHFGIYALYVMYYPQLVAGPIERPQNVIHQFKEHHDFDYARVTDGLKLMAWGMFKKVVVADRLAPYVNMMYAHPENYSGIVLLTGMIFFSVQIYCDFSGYSDIAIGSSKVMGINLMENFRQPYFSRSISEFWKRWHISLSTWFRDYVYIPLGGNRVSSFKIYRNILIVFLLSGFWHGANWTFIIWGGLHGIFLIAFDTSKNIRAKVKNTLGIKDDSTINNIISVVFTFSLVTVAWVFFRGNSVEQAMHILRNSFDLSATPSMVKAQFEQLGFTGTTALLTVAVVVFLFVIDRIQTKKDILMYVTGKSWPMRWAIYYIIIFSIILLGVWGNQQFIYFQF